MKSIFIPAFKHCMRIISIAVLICAWSWSARADADTNSLDSHEAIERLRDYLVKTLLDDLTFEESSRRIALLEQEIEKIIAASSDERVHWHGVSVILQAQQFFSPLLVQTSDAAAAQTRLFSAYFRGCRTNLDCLIYVRILSAITGMVPPSRIIEQTRDIDARLKTSEKPGALTDLVSSQTASLRNLNLVMEALQLGAPQMIGKTPRASFEKIHALKYDIRMGLRRCRTAKDKVSRAIEFLRSPALSKGEREAAQQLSYFVTDLEAAIERSELLNNAVLLYLDRVNLDNPTSWLNDLLQSTEQASVRSHFHALALFARYEMALPFRHQWMSALETVARHASQNSELHFEFQQQLLATAAAKDFVENRVRTVLREQNLGSTPLQYEVVLAKKFKNFHSLFWSTQLLEEQERALGQLILEHRSLDEKNKQSSAVKQDPALENELNKSAERILKKTTDALVPWLRLRCYQHHVRRFKGENVSSLYTYEHDFFYKREFDLDKVCDETHERLEIAVENEVTARVLKIHHQEVAVENLFVGLTGLLIGGELMVLSGGTAVTAVEGITLSTSLLVRKWAEFVVRREFRRWIAARAAQGAAQIPKHLLEQRLAAATRAYLMHLYRNPIVSSAASRWITQRIALTGIETAAFVAAHRAYVSYLSAGAVPFRDPNKSILADYGPSAAIGGFIFYFFPQINRLSIAAAQRIKWGAASSTASLLKQHAVGIGIDATYFQTVGWGYQQLFSPEESQATIPNEDVWITELNSFAHGSYLSLRNRLAHIILGFKANSSFLPIPRSFTETGKQRITRNQLHQLNATTKND